MFKEVTLLGKVKQPGIILNMFMTQPVREAWQSIAVPGKGAALIFLEVTEIFVTEVAKWHD